MAIIVKSNGIDPPTLIITTDDEGLAAKGNIYHVQGIDARSGPAQGSFYQVGPVLPPRYALFGGEASGQLGGGWKDLISLHETVDAAIEHGKAAEGSMINWKFIDWCHIVDLQAGQILYDTNPHSR